MSGSFSQQVMKVLIIGQGIAGSCLAWELKRRGADFTIADRPIAETASRVAAGLVNPLTGRAFRPGWRQEECFSALSSFYPETERELGGSWWQKTPIFRELETEDQLEIWQERQTAPESCSYAGPLFPWPEHWEGKGQAAYTRGSGVLHVETMVNAMRRFFSEQGRFVEAEVAAGDIQPGADGFFHWCGDSFSHIVWCTGWEAGMHPDMAPLKGRPSKGTILDLELKDMAAAIDAFPGVQMMDDPANQVYPMPLYTSEKYDCFVGRLRRDESNPNTFNLWVVGDQIRKGAALNAVQIAEWLIAHRA